MSSIMYPGSPPVRVRLKKRGDSAQVHRIWGTLQSSSLSSLDFLKRRVPIYSLVCSRKNKSSEVSNWSDQVACCEVVVNHYHCLKPVSFQ